MGICTREGCWTSGPSEVEAAMHQSSNTLATGVIYNCEKGKPIGLLVPGKFRPGTTMAGNCTPKEPEKQPK